LYFYMYIAFPSLTPLSLFFFLLYHRHRDLHSFPTRRSSDLSSSLVLAFFMPASPLVFVQTLPAARSPANCVDAADCNLAAKLPIDRKSTRLNSSHQIISYAVFCLKKKNNKK